MIVITAGLPEIWGKCGITAVTGSFHVLIPWEMGTVSVVVTRWC